MLSTRQRVGCGVNVWIHFQFVFILRTYIHVNRGRMIYHRQIAFCWSLCQANSQPPPDLKLRPSRVQPVNIVQTTPKMMMMMVLRMTIYCINFSYIHEQCRNDFEFFVRQFLMMMMMMMVVVVVVKTTTTVSVATCLSHWSGNGD
jgi:hypothetical protein